MKRSWQIVPAGFLISLAALPCRPAHADGKFFRVLSVADEPGIRAQRAVIAYKDGQQTLIVQSDVEGSGDAFGWILPLPANPDVIDACSREH